MKSKAAGSDASNIAPLYAVDYTNGCTLNNPWTARLRDLTASRFDSFILSDAIKGIQDFLGNVRAVQILRCLSGFVMCILCKGLYEKLNYTEFRACLH